MAFFLLLSFLFMLYASPALLFPGLEELRPAQLAGASAFTMLVARKALGGDGWRWSRPDTFLMLALVAGAGVSTIGALWPKLAFDTTVDLAKIGVIYFLVLNCVDSEKRLTRVFAVLIAGGIFPAAGTLWNYFRGDVVDGRAGWIGTYGNPNDLAYTLVILIPLAWQMIPRVQWIFRPLLLGALGLYFAAIMASRSRGGMIGAFVVLLILGLRQSGIAAKGATLGILVVLAIGASLYWTRSEGFQDLGGDFTVHQRIETIRAGWNMFMDHPLFGVGAGCSLVGWPLYAPSNIDFRTSLVIHNTMMQSLAELGVIGFLPLILLVGSAWLRARRIVKQADKNDRLWSYGIALEAALVGYLVCGLSGGYLTSWFPYIIIGLISATAILLTDPRGRDENNA
jgi:O-antigen ligase